MRRKLRVLKVLAIGAIAGSALAVSLTYVTSFGSSGSGSGQFASPEGVAVSGGLVYVADAVNSRIVRFDPANFAGTFTSFGTPGGGSGNFNTPTGVAVSGGLVYVADFGNHRIVRFDPANFAGTSTSFGTFGSGSGNFNSPYGVAVSGGLVYVADTFNSRVVQFDPANFAGTFTSFGTLGAGSGNFEFPIGVAVSGGLVYVGDTNNDRIVRFDPANFAGTFTSFGTLGFGSGNFNTPTGVAVSGSLVYVVDSSNNRIVNFDPANFAGTFTSFGTLGAGSGNFDFPIGVAVSGSLVYVADTSNSRIVELQGPAIQVCKVAGAGVTAGTDFSFDVAGTPVIVAAGPAPNGTCAPPVPVLANTAVITETLPASTFVTAIGASPAAALVSADLPGGTATITTAAAQTTVTFTDAANGSVQICKIAGGGIVPGTTFNFNVAGTPLTVPAGPAPGGTCAAPLAEPTGAVAITETIPAGTALAGVTVGGGALVASNLAAGTATVTVVGGGVTTVTFLDVVPAPGTGFVQVCKVAGPGVAPGTNFAFNVAGMPLTIPAGPPRAAPAGLR